MPSRRLNKDQQRNSGHKMNLRYILRLKAIVLFFVVAVPGNTQDSVQVSDRVDSELTESEIQTAAAWSLTHDEFSQVKDLQLRYQGLLSPNLTPIEWLGIFSHTDEQRNHYATILARQQIEVNSAILKFESAYLEAVKTLATQVSLKSHRDDRLLLITSTECSDSSCSRQLAQSIEHVANGGSLVIYVQDRLARTDLRAWAIVNQIPLQELRSGMITIKQAEGRMLDVKPGIYRAN